MFDRVMNRIWLYIFVALALANIAVMVIDVSQKKSDMALLGDAAIIALLVYGVAHQSIKVKDEDSVEAGSVTLTCAKCGTTTDAESHAVPFIVPADWQYTYQGLDLLCPKCGRKPLNG